jgi:hypothetical protein
VSTRPTYPLALLSSFPPLPSDDRLGQLSQIFSRCCWDHVFFAHPTIFTPTRGPIAPPLQYGIGCLASLCDRSDLQEARNLFWAGSCFWLVMVEVDNGLARSDEMLLAVCYILGLHMRLIDFCPSPSYSYLMVCCLLQHRSEKLPHSC